MIAALGTISFLATLWLLVVIGASILEESGAKIVAALKGEFQTQPQATFIPVRARARARLTRPMRASARIRDAA